MPFHPIPNSVVHDCHCGEHAWFTLSRGYVCLVDAALGPAFACWPWRAMVDKGNVYAARSVEYQHDGKRCSHVHYAHQMVLPTAKHLIPDHINGNGLDNRRDNLRALTPRANSHLQRKKPGCLSSHKGVSIQNGKWYAYIQVGGKQLGLGRFTDEADAIHARRAAERLFYPEAHQ